MLNLANRTEYSFRLAYGQLDKVLAANAPEKIVGICDRHNTYGHVSFEKACKKKGIKPVFGVELALVPDPTLEEKQGEHFLRFIAANNEGLQEIYKLCTKATEQFYYIPRIGLDDIRDLDDVFILTSRPLEGIGYKNVFLDLNPNTPQAGISWAKENNIQPVATSDNFFPRMEHQLAYHICMDATATSRTTPMYILNEWEWDLAVNAPGAFKAYALKNALWIADACNVTLPKAELVHPERKKTLQQLCEDGAIGRGVDLQAPAYKERLIRELDVIHEKKFEDYFYLIADMVQEAKKTMLVGPARGSSCGSLVCYLTGITDIDPIPYGLLFERFIDINRKDIPDIDIDFPDVKRDQVLAYLKMKYGEDCVAQLGTVSRYKAKVTIGDVSKALDIPMWEVQDFKENCIERLDGDSRANMCIMDSFKEMEIGQKILAKFPSLKIAEEIEGHARHSGKHAAGIVVTADPVYKYCSVDHQTGCAQVDKYDAEELNLLKIDALGLRTLSVIEDCLSQIGWDKSQLQSHRMDDEKAFAILNEGKFTGIFQFEGYTLQGLCHQMKVSHFEDIVSLTALARPGPLMAGMTNQWLKRKSGAEEFTHENVILNDIMKDTHGVIIYQEQIMFITRRIGLLSWEDVCSVRKAMGKTLGQEAFDQYKTKFLDGAVQNQFERKQAEELWDRMNTFGSYAFNRSHSVAYGMVSYWCMILKAHFPLEYAAACLRHSKDDEQVIRILRELHAEGISYKPFDKDKSQGNWSVQDGSVVGGLTGVKGIGPKIANEILSRRRDGKELTPRQMKLLDNATTPYDQIFECRQRWGHILDNPKAYDINTPITFLKDLNADCDGIFLVIAKIKTKEQKDKNDLHELKKRNGKAMTGQTQFLSLSIEDDTDVMSAGVGVYKYLKYGKPIVEEGKEGDWYIFKGRMKRGFRKLWIDRWKKLS